MTTRARINLTELGVRRARPDPAKRVELHDDVVRGLMLRIATSGGKVWWFVKAKDGARFKVRIGEYPATSLADARAAASNLSSKTVAGTLSKKRPKHAKAAAVSTVDELVTAFIADYKTAHKSWRDVELDLGKHVQPQIGKRRPDKIRRNDVGDVLLELLDQPRVHNKIKSHLSGLFKWSARRGIVEANPVVGFENLPTKARDRVLTDAEMKAIWKACDAVGYPYGPYVQLLMLLGQRRTETAAMELARVGQNSGLWDIPAERTKNSRAHLVPLPQVARDIIAALPLMVDEEGEPRPFLFPALSKPDSHLTTYSEGKELIDAASGVKDWWLHDLRRTMSTGMAGLGVQPVVIEAVLNHASGQQSGVAGVYNRYAYLDEKRAALDAWATRLQEIVSAN